MGIDASKSANRSRSSVKSRRKEFRTLICENLERRDLMNADSPRLLSVAPNSGEILSTTRANSLLESPRELVFRFSEALDATTIGSGIRITRAGGDASFGTASPLADVTVQPAFQNFGESNLIVVARFSQPLPDDLYRIEVLGLTVPGAIKDLQGLTLQPRRDKTDRDTYDFNLELGTKIIAVVPQPIDRASNGALTQRNKDIEIYFNDNELFYDSQFPNASITTGAAPNPTVVDPAFYSLILTKDTVSPNDDVVTNPQSITFDPVAKRATLSFATDIDQIAGGAGTFRLRVGSNEAVASAANPLSVNSISPPTDPAGFLTGVTGQADLGTISGTFSTLINQEIRTVSNPLLADFPGSDFEPGHREIQDISHLAGGADTVNGITTIFYSFMETESYGVDSAGRPLFTSITPDQKQRVREVLELYSAQLGVDFVEQLGSLAAAGVDPATKRIVVGDMTPNGRISGPGDIISSINRAPIGAVPALSLVILDGSEAWDNGFGNGSNIPGTESFFKTAMHEIGQSLGLDNAFDLPIGTIMRNDLAARRATGLEQIYPGNNDVVHGQHLFRPDNRDVDLYKFVVAPGAQGQLRAETIAERLNNSSNLDTHLTLFRKNADGTLETVAANDNYFSDDSLVRADLVPGEYYLSVTASGNEDNNPLTLNSGSGAVSQGLYQLRLDFKSNVANQISEEVRGSTAKGSALDGDGDGIAGGNFDFWFRAATPYTVAGNPPVRTLFVDKAFTGTTRDGSLTNPFNRIDAAAAASRPGDIIRLVGDTRTTSLLDDAAYEIGTGGASGGSLSDGATLDVPRGVTLMIDAGAILKFGGSKILVGSNDSTTNRSNAAIQVLGLPNRPVYFTSYDDESLGRDTNPLLTNPAAGNWGGIEIRNDFDRSQGRVDRERDGIFLNTISNADMRWGGGQVGVGALSKVVSPIDLTEVRPFILNNVISRSADAAITADPNSFEETLFTESRYQNVGSFIPDYSRIGPDIRSNSLLNNSINGLFVRIDTLAGQNLKPLSVPGRMNDSEITIVLGENLIIEGTPGGSGRELALPDSSLISMSIVPPTAGSGFAASVAVNYLVTYMDRFGQESLPSPQRSTVTVAGQSVRLTNLAPATLDYVSRKIWRQENNSGPFRLAAVQNRDDVTFVDNGFTLSGQLQTQGLTSVQRARRDASLVVDPGVVIKSLGGRIEVGISATMLAEGTESKPIVFTSRLDDRYGAGGNFDTNNDGFGTPTAGNWAGIVSRHLGELSIDNALITFGGGNSRVPGGFASFNAIEIHQSTARVSNSVLETNSSGTTNRGTTNRDSRGVNDAAAIFIVGSQPVLLNNVIRNNSVRDASTANFVNDTAAISIDGNSLNSESVRDFGRQTGTNQRENVGIGNFGPLINNNQLGGNALNGMRVRGATLTTEGVWDDTDIVHMLQSEIVVVDFHTYGGLRLTSKSDESLVIKLLGNTAGFTATGRPLDIKDRIGGSLQVLGSPGFPVVLTSLNDDSIGAGFDFSGKSLLDTNGNGNATSAAPGNWRSLLFDPFSNDRNVDASYEREPDQIASQGFNDFPSNAQDLGSLATSLSGGDENLRLGMTITGSIASPSDIDIYRFTGTAGSMVWFDVDQTSGSLDSVIELVDGNGQIIALSNNSIDESTAGSVYSDTNLVSTIRAWPMDQSAFTRRNSANQTPVDFLGVNPLDAGFRAVLPGVAGSVNNYFVRVRSSNVTPAITNSGAAASLARLLDVAAVRQGITVGEYKLQLRLQQTDEVAGSTVRFADIRFAANGIDAKGQPLHSQLVGEAGEPDPTERSNVYNSANPILLGNIFNTDRAGISVAGRLAPDPNNPTSLVTGDNIDYFDFQVFRDSVEQPNEVSDATRWHQSVVFDLDYADGFGRPNTQLWIYQKVGNNLTLVATGDDSNIQDDQAAPLSGSNLTDLARGSNGRRDAYVGPFELPQGNYVVAVSNRAISDSSLDAYTVVGGSTTTSVRLEPLESVRRISEDRFDTGNPGRPTTTAGPVMRAFGGLGAAMSPAVPNTDPTALPNAVPFNLSDVTFFVAATLNGTPLMQYANALTGAKEAEASTLNNNSQFVNDIAVSPGGRAFGTRNPDPGFVTDANSGSVFGIDIGDASAAIGAGVGPGLTTFGLYPVAGGTPVVRQSNAPGTTTAIGDGMVFTALTYSNIDPDTGNNPGNATFYGVGSRRGNGSFNETPLTTTPPLILRNIIYRLNPDTGAVIDFRAGLQSKTANDGNRLAGAGASQWEYGYFDAATGLVTGFASVNSQFFGVSTLGELVTASIGPGNTGAGTLITTIRDPLTNAAINFTGMTAGPRNVEGGRYANLLFGITAAGRIYAFNTAGVLQPIFPRGQRFIDGTAFGTIAGIDFSSLDVNLWHASDRENGTAGHGRLADFNNSRDAFAGNRTAKFGFANPTSPNKQPGNWSGIYNTYVSDAAGDNVAAPGGAMGALESDLIDLRSYSADDQPILYFNYTLPTQNSAGNNDGTALGDGRPALDTFRVYGAGESGNWVLLGTNNSIDNRSYTDMNGQDEFDISISQNQDAFGRTRISSEVFDNAGWRQARINMGALAGQRDVRIRFEFNTGGDFRTGDPLRGGQELVAIAGDRLTDGNTFVVAGTTFEFDLGLVLQLPSGASVVDGDQISINETLYTFKLTGAPAAREIGFASNFTPTQLANSVRTALTLDGRMVETSAQSPDILNVVGLPAAGTYSILGADPAIIIGRPGVVAGRTAVNVTNSMTAIQVRDSIVTSLAAALNVAGQTANTSVYRTRGNVILLHGTGMIVTNPGPLGATIARAGDAFGGRDGGFAGAGLRTQSNKTGSVHIDDIVIGFAERGEKVIGATPSAAPTFSPTGGYQLTGDSGPPPGGAIDEIEGGTYQLEIREAADYGTTAGTALRLDSFPPPPLGRTYDTNDRLTKSSRLIFNSPSAIADGATFKLSDGVNTATFEFDVATSAADRAAGTTPGNVPITILPSETREQIARKIRDAINSTAAQAVIKITASTNGDMKVGTADRPANGRAIAIDLHGPVANDELGNASSALFSAGGVPLTLVSFGSESAFGEDLGDANIRRDQGQFIVSSNSISRSSGFGLNIDAAPQSQTQIAANTGNRAYPGVVRNLVTLNSSNVAPGVVVMNNVLSGNLAGGINISGDTGGTTATGIPPQTVARVINNTLYGRRGDIGINVTEGASPSLLNNIIANFGTGINVVGAASLGGTILGANLYQSNATTVTPASVGISESFPILLAAGDALFVDGPNGRFYLKALSQAIDSSFSSLENRANIEQVKSAIGLPTSPILAPAFDVNGLRRSDDPAVSPPFGLGQNVFIDRGAIDRVDFVGPIAVLQRPLDNDSNMLDTDPFNTYVRLRTGNYDFFEVLLDERTGTGTDPNTITADSLILTENGRPLVQGVDYIFGFSANSRTIRLTPLAGFWRRDSIYEMTLINKPTLRVDPTSGATILDGARVTVNASNGAQAVLEFDSGFKLTVPQTLTFKVPAAGSASAGITDGQTFQISNGALTVTFEFDTNNLVTAGNRPIAIIADQTATQVRDAIVAALRSATNADLNLGVKGYGTDLIHLGTLAVHNASVGTSRLTRQGVASGVADGQTFMFDPANGPAITLEFNLTGDTAFGAGNRLITFDRTDTYIDLAGKIAAVMATVVPQGFAPVEDLKDGTVQIGGQVGDLLTVTGSQLTVTGMPGVTGSFELAVPAAGGTAIADATRFSIRNAAGQTVVFEFDKDGTITPGNRGISIRNTDTADQIAVAISTSIAGSGLGITPTAATRFIRLNEPRGSIVSVLTSGLVLTGVSGGAISVPFVSSFNNNSVSAQLVKAFSSIGLGVNAYALGYGTFIVEGVTSITGVATTSIGPVSDLAGNWLLPNRVNSLTQFTILMPEVSVDYGDAMERPNTGSTSNTLLVNNGVRHGLYPTGVPVLALGQFADGDVDGMPSTSADGDDFSSSFAFTAGMPLTLSPKGPAQLSVSAPAPAMLGTRVTISDTVNRTVTYQFWDSSVPASAVPTGIVGVDLKLVTTASGAAAALQSEIFKSILAGTITEIYAIVNGNVVSLGGTFGHTFDLSQSGGFVQRVPKGSIGLSVNPTLTGLAAGQVLTIQDGSGNSVTFQIIDQAAPSALSAGNVPLVINFANATQASFAADVAKAINDEIQKGTLILPTATVVGGTVNVNADDEDGVRFDGLFNPLIPPVPVVITSTDTGFIDAWVDWNQDNDFEDAGEKILSSEPVNAGENTFLISTPLNATVGYTTARFRLSATGGLFTYGLAIGGEVEDHVIEVLAGIPPVAVNDPDPSKAALYRVDEDNVLIVTAANGVLTNDLDPDNPAVAPSTTPPLVAVFDEDPFASGIQPLTSTQNGTLVLLADGSFTYTPAPNFFGTDTFVYRVTDRRLVGNQPATVTITVNPVNDVPFANDDTQTIDEDIVQSWPGALFTGNDIKGITLPLPGSAIPNENPQALIVKSAQLVDALGNPRAAKIGELLPAVVGNTVSYTPGSNYNQDIAGPVLIKLEIEDNGVTGFSQTLDPKTAFSTLTVNIRPVNDRPLFDFPLTQTVSLLEDPVPAGQDVVVPNFVSNVSAGPILIPGLVGSADDELLGSTLPTPIVPAQTVRFILNTLAPFTSAFETLPSIGTTGSSRDLTFKLKPDVNRLDYVTATNPSGSLFVEVIAEDNGPQGGLNLFRTVVQTITINIDPINDNPVVTNDSETIDEDIVQSWPGIRFTANDVPGPGNESVLSPDPRAQLLIVKSAQLIDSTGAVRLPRIGEMLPTVSGNVVNYTPGSNYNQDIAGPVLIRLEIEDNGVSGFPPVVTPKSSFSTLTVNIRPVNDRPLFDFPLTQTVSLLEDPVPAGQDVVVPNFVSNVSAGPILIPGLVGSADDELLGSMLPTPAVPAQTVRFILNTPAPYNTAFATLPSIGATGSSRDLTFKLKPEVNRLDYVTATNPNGSLFVEVIAEDNGPQGGLNLFETVVQTITINIDPVNDNPVVANDTETINEDIPQSWAGVRFTANDLPGPGNESGQTLIVKSAQLIDSTGAVRAPRSGELLPPVTGNIVNYTPGTHYNNQFTEGPVFILLEIQDNGMSGFPTSSDPKSSFSTLTVNINPVNDRPLFTLPVTNIGLLEDPTPADQVYTNFVTEIAAGPTGADDELGNVPGVTGQGLRFLVRALNPASFTTQPRVVGTGSSRDFTFRLAPDVNALNSGPIVVEVYLEDLGPQGGINQFQSPKQFITINVVPVNDPPEFTLSTSTFSTTEDAPRTIIPGFMSAPTPGPVTAVDEINQNLTTTIVAANPAYFSFQPRLTGAGDLEFQLAPDVNSLFSGSLDILITVVDDGLPTAASTTKTLTITAADINDQPTFVLNSTNIVAREDEEFLSGTTLTEVPGFASNLLPGPITALDEFGSFAPTTPAQVLTFVNISVSNPTLFSQLPTIDGTGKLSFKTAPDRNGSAVVVVRLSDNGRAGPPPNNSLGRTATFTITLNAINDAPEFTIPASTTVNEDQGVISLPGFATGIRPGPGTAIDENTQVLTFDVRAENPSAFLVQPTLQSDGTLIFQTAKDVNNNTVGIQRRVFVSLRDNGLGTPSPNVNMSAEQVFTVNINPVNDPPIPDALTLQGVENGFVDATEAVVLAGDVAGPADEVAAGQRVRITQVERTTDNGGIVTPVFIGDRIVSFRYQTPLNFSGNDLIRYVVSDNGLPQQSATGTITITVGPINNPPQFIPGSDVTVLEDTTSYSANWATGILPGPPSALDELATQTILRFETPTDNDALFSVLPSVSTTGVLTFSLAKDAVGRAIVDVTAVDSGASNPPNQNRSITSKLTIVANPVNDAPGFIVIGDVSVAEDSNRYSAPAIRNIVPAAGMNSTPPTGLDEAGQSVSIFTSNNNPSLFSVQPTISGTGVLEFVPAQDAFGTAIVSVFARDNGSSTSPNVNQSTPQLITVVIRPANDAPVAVNDSYATGEDIVLTVSAPGVLTNDRDVDLPNDALSVSTFQATSSLGAIVTMLPNGQFTYDSRNAPQLQRLVGGETATDTFTYTVRDLAGSLSNLATVTITVSGANDSPIAVNDAFNVPFGVTELLNVLANDRDPDNSIDPRTVEIGQLAANGTATALSTGRIQYRPNTGYRGPDSFTYRVRDSLGAISNEATVTINVNTSPVAQPDSVLTPVNTPIDIDVLKNDSDPDGSINRGSLTIVSGPDVGTAVIQATGFIRYTPPKDFVGTANLQYVVLDDSGQSSNIANVTIQVTNSIHQNPVNRLDVNADGFVSPIDVLIVVNDLNFNGPRVLPLDLPVPPYLDVNGDKSVSPLDVLELINFINARGNSGSGEGEGEASMASLGYTQDHVMMVSIADALRISTEFERTTQLAKRFDTAVTELSDSPVYGPALSSTSENQSGTEENLESLLTGWITTKSKRSSNVLDSVFADEDWM